MRECGHCGEAGLASSARWMEGLRLDLLPFLDKKPSVLVEPLSLWQVSQLWESEADYRP
jgi:hypothetical protein